MFEALGSRSATVLLALFVATTGLSGCDSAADRAQDHYERGVELAANGEPVKAGLEFRNALKLRSDFVEALFGLAEVEERQGNFERAFGLYRSVAEQVPDNIQTRIRLAYILLAAGQFDAAQRYADEAIAIDDKNAGALVAKAAVALKLDNRGEAVRLARAALEQEGANSDALMVLASERLLASDPAGALRFLNQAGAESERDVGLQALRLTALDRLGDEPGVEGVFAKLSEFYPDNPAFRQGLVRWYLGKGRTDDAEKAMRAFATDNPTNDEAQLALVGFLNSVRGPSVAIAELKRLSADRKAGGQSGFRFDSALAQLLFATGEKAEAIELVEQVAATAGKPEDKNTARLIHARMAMASNDSGRAQQLVDTVLADDAKNVDALSIRAALHLRADKDADAIDDLLAALNEAPDNANLHGLLAEAYEGTGEVVLAEEQYAKALALTQNAPTPGLQMAQFLLRYGKTDQARRVLEQVRARTPNDTRVLAQLAQLRLATQDWVGAQEIAKALRGVDDAGSEVTADRVAAAALAGLNRYEESINLLQSLTTDKSVRPSVLPDLIRSYIQAGRQDTAAAYLQQIIQEDSENLQAKLLLASVYANKNDAAAAEATIKEAAAADSGVVAQTALAQFYAGSGRLDAAEQAVRVGLERDPENTPLRLLLASLMERMERFDEAIAEFEKLLAANPDSALIANDLASLLSERSTDPQALDRAFTIAQRLRSSEIPQFLDTLGWIYFLRGEYASALPLLKTAAERLPQLALVQFHLGMALKQLGQDQLAAESLEKAISLSTPALIESDRKRAEEVLKTIKAPT